MKKMRYKCKIDSFLSIIVLLNSESSFEYFVERKYYINIIYRIPINLDKYFL